MCSLLPPTPCRHCHRCGRRLAASQVPSLTEGGALWFTDLTVADPTYMLPALAGLSFLLTIELGAADGMQGQVGGQAWRRAASRGPSPRCPYSWRVPPARSPLQPAPTDSPAALLIHPCLPRLAPLPLRCPRSRPRCRRS